VIRWLPLSSLKLLAGQPDPTIVNEGMGHLVDHLKGQDADALLEAVRGR
jgi:hypothetical protein